MGFDRNTVIGFVLLAVLFAGYFWYVSSNQKAAMEQQKLEQRRKDSIAALTRGPIDTAQLKADSIRIAQQRDSLSAGDFAPAAAGEEQLAYVENDVVRITFTNKGGWIKQVQLKKYKAPDSSLVTMAGTNADWFAYSINTQNGQSTESNKLFFNAAVINKTADGTQTISYQLPGPDGKAITHSFVVKPADYLIDAKIDLNGANQMLSQQTLNLNWQVNAVPQQADVDYEKTQTRLVYKTGGKFDYNTAFSGTTESLTQPTAWVGLKQQFFNSTLLVPGTLASANAEVLAPTDTVKNQIGLLKLNGRINVPQGNTVSIPLQVYYGPNDYHVLKGYNNDMHNIVDLGSGMFAFVKWINRWLILPVFEFLSKIMGGASGWAILLLTIFIRLLIAPLTYSSYLSGAKMKALRPEIDALRAKLGGDQQAMSMEQMKLFREAGVNPLGGCIPALFQIPIFFALYSFFNSNIDLRGVPFLWAKDLSSYDSILDFGFNIPFYGGHISLFTITACATSMLISLYSMASTPDTGNPVMKYMPYIFPVMMLFIFNKLPSALTWYYTVSNVITLALQFVIQNYIIDHRKILEKIEANKAKPKSKSKWQERLEQMQESQKKMQHMRNKQQGKK